MKDRIKRNLLCLAVLLMPLVIWGHERTAEPRGQSIPFENLGAEARKQYSGDGISITPRPGGAGLRAVFQRLEGEATGAGLWLTSTAAEDVGRAERFRVLAIGVGRESAAPVPLAPAGTVWATAETVAFVRPGLVEECRVSMDGVRQDFVISERPAGSGALRVHLALSGATAEVAAFGAKLRLAGSGREIAYSRLRVTDATGKALAAEIEVPAAGRLTVRVDDAQSTYPVRIDPTFSDADWVSMGGALGVNGEVRTITVDGSGHIYIGGNFTAVGAVAASRIAKWDGSVWSPLGLGLNGSVFALSPRGGDLYVGGDFTTAGGGSARFIAKWDGNAWSALSSEVNSRVYALAANGGDLYAGGWFTLAGGIAVNRVAKWNGSTWSALGSGMPSDVFALAVSGSDLYAGGFFTSAGGVSASGIARWNGSAWSAVGSGTSGLVVTLAVSGSDLYAGGIFSSVGGVAARNIAKWNGNAWSALGSGMNNGVYALALSGGDLYASGFFTTAGGVGAGGVAKWDGNGWSGLGSGLNGGSYTVAASGNALYVGGEFTTAGGKAARGVAKAIIAHFALCVSGNGVEIANGDHIPDAADHTDFGGVEIVGDSAVARAFTITNRGEAALNLTGSPLVSLSGDEAFTVTQQPASATVPGDGGTQSFQITFDPATAGLATATVTIASDDPDQSSYSFAIAGVGLSPSIIVAGNGVEIVNGDTIPDASDHTDFGSANIESQVVTRTFMVKNRGNAALNLIGSPRVKLGGSGAFTVTEQPASAIVTANGGTQSFQVTFDPDTVGLAAATVTIASDDPDHGSYTFAIGGAGVAPGEIGFEDAVVKVPQGANQALLTVRRTDGMAAVSVNLVTADGSALSMPPFSPALAGTDYTTLNSVVEFGEGETRKEVLITLNPKLGTAVPNKQFAARLVGPTDGATLGAVSTASIQILAADTMKPSVSITAPTAKASDLSPFLAKGLAGDARGIHRVEVTLNGNFVGNATLGMAKSPTTVPWSLPIGPIEGDNFLTITAFDLRGNFTTATRNFNFLRRYALSLSRVSVSSGMVALSSKPPGGASTLNLSPAATDPKTSLVVPGTVVKLTARAKTGFVFSKWQNLPVVADVIGNVVTFTMPVEDVAVTASFVASPFNPPAGRVNTFMGLLHPTGTPSKVNVGLLNGTLNAGGGFTGKILIDGVAQSINATYFGDGSAVLKSGTTWQNSLNFGGRELTLGFDLDDAVVTASLINGANTSLGEATRLVYSATKKVRAALLSSPTATKGFYTVAFPSKEQTPPINTTTYPQGHGFATLNLTNMGGVSLTGTLADGTGITAGSSLLAGDTAPFLVQLPTPGAASIKGGSFSGVFVFENLADSDVSAQDLVWFRAGSVGTSAATHLYTFGWTNGVRVDAVGTLYNTTTKVQAALGLPVADPGNGNGELMFTGSKLMPAITKTNFNISGNTVTKIPANDGSYTLTLAPSTGGFGGSFGPNWPNLNSARPAFKGIILQKGASKGGYGFFISNAKNDQDPESGAVTLSAQD